VLPRFLDIFNALPTADQLALVNSQLAPILDTLSPHASDKILAAAKRLRLRATSLPALDLKARRREITDLLAELERDAKRSVVKGRSQRDELLEEIARSIAEWLPDVWRTVYEGRAEFEQAHECLMFCSEILGRLDAGRGG
jgi:hypothetical protein